jgi:F-type H+-transporting ATPase subunit b
MDSTIQALQALFLKALPTLFLVVVLHFYLKFVFFRPLEKKLQERFDATEGARRIGHESLARAEQKAADYEAALKKARADLYLEQERLRRQLEDEKARAVAEARRAAEQRVREAKAGLEREVVALKTQLAQEAETLAERILAAVLPGRAA